MRRLRTIATAVLALFCATCRDAAAQAPVLPLPATDQQQLTKFLGAAVVGQALPCQPITDPTALFPLQPRSRTYQLTSGANAGNTEVLTLSRARRPSGLPAWRLGLSPVLAGFLNNDPQRGLVMPALTDTAEGFLILSTPPNVFLPRNLSPGQSTPFTHKIAANYLDNPTDTDHSGTLSGQLTYVGCYQVTVPAGTFPAVLTRHQSTGSVGPASVADTSWTFFAPGVGIVAMVTQEDVAAFWIYHVDTTTGKVLLSQ